jgi:hypothetical protein
MAERGLHCCDSVCFMLFKRKEGISFAYSAIFTKSGTELLGRSFTTSAASQEQDMSCPLMKP